MHELSIALSMIDQILEEAEQRGALQVEVVHLRLGVSSGVYKDALMFAYEVSCEGTSLAGSRLEIIAGGEHWMAWYRADEVAARIRAFLK